MRENENVKGNSPATQTGGIYIVLKKNAIPSLKSILVRCGYILFVIIIPQSDDIMQRDFPIGEQAQQLHSEVAVLY